MSENAISYKSKQPLRAILTYSDDANKTYFEEPSGFNKVNCIPGDRLLTFEFFKHLEDDVPMYVFIVKPINFISFSLENANIKNSW